MGRGVRWPVPGCLCGTRASLPGNSMNCGLLHKVQDKTHRSPLCLSLKTDTKAHLDLVVTVLSRSKFLWLISRCRCDNSVMSHASHFNEPTFFIDCINSLMAEPRIDGPCSLQGKVYSWRRKCNRDFQDPLPLPFISKLWHPYRWTSHIPWRLISTQPLNLSLLGQRK